MFEKIEEFLNTEVGAFVYMLIGLLLMGICGGIEHGTFPFPF